METTLKVEGQKGLVTAQENGKEVGELTFKLLPNEVMMISHTLVHEGNEGKGIGKLLVQKAVEYAQEQRLKILPLCSFARVYIERKPELHHLLV
ncbi:MAG: N-acetyltransferase [Bacteroidaceae bacterium]|nr:N-acetyltransferase [Bacteroidaceae bacterium]